MANEQNLKNGAKTQFKSGEEAAKNGAKGGKASGKARRRFLFTFLRYKVIIFTEKQR